jgi:AcrR family transcriptional regulator
MTDPTRQRLLDAAEQVFADKGFKAASVRDICRLAGANVAAVNYHFGNKERLYIEAVKHAHRCCSEGMPFPDCAPGTAPVRKLRDFVRVMVSRMMQPSSLASTQLMMRELAQPTTACAEVVQEYVQPLADKLGGILGELLTDASRQKQFLTAFSIVGQCLFYRHHRAVASLLVGQEEFQKFDVDLVANHVAEFTCNALGIERKTARRRTASPRSTIGDEP